MIMLCRSEEKANTAIKWITDNAVGDSNGTLIFEQCDISSMLSVRKCAERLLVSLDKIDILVNNAGIVWDHGRKVTEDGFELTFATNHLGHFLLTDLLIPLLKKSAESGFTPRCITFDSLEIYHGHMIIGVVIFRIVNVSSEAYQFVNGIMWDDMNMENMSYGSQKAYGHSKLANLLHAKGLARRLKDSGILAFSLHPGLSLNISRNISVKYFAPHSLILQALSRLRSFRSLGLVCLMDAVEE